MSLNMRCGVAPPYRASILTTCQLRGVPVLLATGTLSVRKVRHEQSHVESDECRGANFQRTRGTFDHISTFLLSPCNWLVRTSHISAGQWCPIYTPKFPKFRAGQTKLRTFFQQPGVKHTRER